jgi:hypothetical protein
VIAVKTPSGHAGRAARKRSSAAGQVDATTTALWLFAATNLSLSAALVCVALPELAVHTSSRLAFEVWLASADAGIGGVEAVA